MMNGPNRNSADLDPRRRRLLFRAWHRGTREMDLLMGSFCEGAVGTLSEEELAELERLIELPDPLLYAWISDPTSIPLDFRSELLHRLCHSRRHLTHRKP
jgi:antitoxin CptB